MSDVKAMLDSEKYMEVVCQVIEMNKEIVKQNTLIIQAMTLPKLIITENSTNNWGG